MSTTPVNPLNDQHLAQINHGLSVIDTAEKQILMAKQAGIDVGDKEKQLADNKAKLLSLKRTYFPNT